MTKANWVTGIAIGLSWLAILFLIRGDIYLSCLIAISAFLVDCLDGWVARYFHEESEIGRQMDGFSDAFLYLIWPSLVYYLYFGLSDWFSVLVQVFFIGAGVYRLARFNSVGYVKIGKTGKGYQGLPVVFSFLVICLLLISNKFGGAIHLSILANVLILIHSGLMLTMYPFPKPKSVSVIMLLGLILLAFLWYGKFLF